MDRTRLPVESRLPGFSGATGWLHSEPLSREELRGKVVLVDFGTFTCINWIRTLPFIRSWAETYAPHGLAVVSVHTPEFSIEHDVDSIGRAISAMGLEHPIAIDNAHAVWDAFANRYWPARYIADADGRIRHHHFGEGGYDRSDQVIRHLLQTAGHADLPEAPAPVDAVGIEAPADWDHLSSPETYLGLARSTGFASPHSAAADAPHDYTVPPFLQPDEWALEGVWTLGAERAVLEGPSGRIRYRFHARDLNLILAPPSRDAPIRFRVRLDGEPPGDASGLDVDADGTGTIGEPRLYQLVRQPPPIEDRIFEIELLDRGAAAFCFTFG